MSSTESRSALTIVLGIIGVIMLIGLIYFWTRSSNAKKEAEKLEVTRDSLYRVKTDLEMEIDSLSSAFTEVAFQNDSLTGSLANARKAISERDQRLRSLNSKMSNDITTLNNDIEVLVDARDELQKLVLALREENQMLVDSNVVLKDRVQTYQRKTANLETQLSDAEGATRMMEERMNRLVDKAFKATAFNVNMERKNDKPTVKSRRVREIKVGFDLVDVPDEHMGDKNVYLAITDINGVPIGIENPKIKVGNGEKKLVIEAQESKKVNIGRSQRLEFSHELDYKLAEGLYLISIYTDEGLLGSTTIQLI